jgi:hypothetical protein
VDVSEPGDGGGLRGLVEALLDANLARDPRRACLITRREAAALRATDAGLAVTLQFLPGAVGGAGTVLVHDGEDPWAEIVVHAPSAALLELAAAPSRFGLPDVLHPDGRAIVGDLVRRRIRVQGLARHLGTLRRLSQLLSVT